MKCVFLESVEDTRPLSNGCAVTLGVFDGMHQGHLRVLDATCEAGKRLDADKVVLTFSLHPETLLNGKPPEMILTLEHRLRLIERSGIDLAVVIPFDETTRNTPAIDFLGKFLLNTLKVQAIILGHDSAFGKNREGNFEYLEGVKDQYGFDVYRTPEVKVRGDTISSTRIREAIRSGDLPLVEEMLGRELSLLGKVVPGDGRGRTIGFPTANLDCRNAILPPYGVYAVKVLLNKVMRRGVMNLGRRPTFHEEQAAPTVEVHIPNFESDLYGQDLEIFITRKIRDEMRFDSVKALINAIRQDIATLGR